MNTHARRILRPLGARVSRANVQIAMDGEASAHIVRKANHTNRFFSFRVEDSPLLAAGSFNFTFRKPLLRIILSFFLVGAFVASTTTPPAFAAEEVVVYSARNEQLIKPLLMPT